jgi:hypothetical protein
VSKSFCKSQKKIYFEQCICSHVLHFTKGVYLTGKEEKSKQAKRIYHMGCCGDNCLHVLGKKRAYPLIESCLEEVDELSRFERHNYLFDKLLQATEFIDSKGKC